MLQSPDAVLSKYVTQHPCTHKVRKDRVGSGSQLRAGSPGTMNIRGATGAQTQGQWPVRGAPEGMNRTSAPLGGRSLHVPRA